MLLSNTDIHAALDSGRLVMIPEPSPRFPSIESPNCPYSTTSVNLTLSDELAVPKDGELHVLDIRTGRTAEMLAQAYPKLTIRDRYILLPQRFILGRTVEKVELPLQKGRPSLAARVEGRSSLARCGLIVHFTAPTIHAGFEGTITLEIINLGAYPIALFPGMEICQLLLEEVLGEPFANPSGFQGQQTTTGQ